MMKIISAGALLVLAGCANSRASQVTDLREKGKDPAHPLFVGHSDTGDIVVAASHFDAMSGMAVVASDVGEKSNEMLRCARQMMTGTHVAKWICRYESDIRAEWQETQNYLDKPRNSLGRGAVQAPPPAH